MAAEGDGTFSKVYKDGNFVAETLQFEIDQDETAGAPRLVVDNVQVDEETEAIPFRAIVDSSTKVGEYTYTVKEIDVKTQGVTYGKEEIIVKVLVVADSTATYGVKVGTIGVEDTGNGKNDTITNTYEVGELTVTKKIAGNMIKNSDKFDFTVTFKAEEDHAVIEDITWSVAGEDKTPIAGTEFADDKMVTMTFKLSANDSAVFKNIPYGVTYTVLETPIDGITTVYAGSDIDATGDFTFENGVDKAVGARKDSLTDGIMSATKENVTVTNYKYQSVDTGIIVNNLPYILVLAGVAVAAVVLFRRKRYSAM